MMNMIILFKSVTEVAAQLDKFGLWFYTFISFCIVVYGMGLALYHIKSFLLERKMKKRIKQKADLIIKNNYQWN